MATRAASSKRAGYLEIHRIGPVERRFGFKGTTPVARTMALMPNAQVTSIPPSSSNVPWFRRADFMRLALGMLARVDTMPGLAVSEAGSSAVRLDVAPDDASPQPFDTMLEFDPETRVPTRIVWRARMTVHVPGTVAGSGGGSGGPGPVGPDTPEETVTMSFVDRRDVDGYRLPHRVSRAAKGVTLWEMRFTQIEVNPPLTDEDFQ